MDAPQGYVDYIYNDQVIPLNIECQTLIARDHLAKNITTNLAREIPRFVQGNGFRDVKREPVAIVGAGPTLRETIESVRGFKNVLVCGSAHDYVVRKGIVPTYAVVADGGAVDKENLSLAHKETTYFLASQCDPSLFEHLSDFNIEMWHYRGQATPDLEEEAKLLNGELSICWGTTVTLTAIYIAMMLGFQDLHFFGFDSCYGDYGVADHCCKIAGAHEYEKMEFTVGPEKKKFISNMGFAAQAEQFFKIVEADGRYFHSTIHGDGLIAEMARQGEPGLEKYISLA